MLFLGIRALIHNDEDILLSQLEDARSCFPDSHIVLAVCCDPPSTRIKGMCDEILYYSDTPKGLTLPLHLLIQYAQDHGADELILCDGDDQFIFSELRRIYDMAHGSTYDAVIPIRNRKSLFFCDDSLDRVLIEDCENLLFRAACPNMLKDPQPGAVFILNKKTINCLSLASVPSWIGDIVITTQLINAGRHILETTMDIREQRNTNMTLDHELLKIRQMESYFGVNLPDALPDQARYASIIRCYEDYIRHHLRA